MKLLALLCCLALVACQVGDYFGTTAALNSGRGYEANPIVRTIGLLPMKVTSAGLSVFICYGLMTHPVILIGVTVTLCAVHGYVIWKGWRIARG